MKFVVAYRYKFSVILKNKNSQYYCLFCWYNHVFIIFHHFFPDIIMLLLFKNPPLLPILSKRQKLLCPKFYNKVYGLWCLMLLSTIFHSIIKDGLLLPCVTVSSKSLSWHREWTLLLVFLFKSQNKLQKCHMYNTFYVQCISKWHTLCTSNYIEWSVAKNIAC